MATVGKKIGCQSTGALLGRCVHPPLELPLAALVQDMCQHCVRCRRTACFIRAKRIKFPAESAHLRTEAKARMHGQSAHDCVVGQPL
eukprot:5592381-Alexandrium_andersonii.AAC.1